MDMCMDMCNMAHAHAVMHICICIRSGPLATQAAGWRDRTELTELAGPQLAKRARGTEFGDGASDGIGDVSQHVRLLAGLLPPYVPMERDAIKVVHW